MQKKITAVDLVNSFQELLYQTPLKNWGSDKFMKNVFYSSKYINLKAISKAFGIDDLATLMDGTFIENKDFPFDVFRNYLRDDINKLFSKKNIIDDSKSWCDNLNKIEKSKNILEEDDVVFIYSNLMKYRTSIQKIIHSNSGLYSHLLYDLYPFLLLEDTNIHIKEKLLPRINEPLAFIISPNKQEFSLKELIKDFGYKKISTFNDNCF